MTLLDAPSRKLPAEVYTADEVARLVKACSTRAKTGIRNRALIITLYRSGLRLSEALALRPKDMDLNGSCLRVLRGKGDKSRTVGMDASAFAYLNHWLTVREGLGISARQPVFCTLKGGTIATAYIRALLPRLGRKVGIEKRCHAHGLRHSLAYELANEGTPLHIIQSQLGHSNLATTSRYINHLAPIQVIDAMRARTFVLE